MEIIFTQISADLLSVNQRALIRVIQPETVLLLVHQPNPGPLLYPKLLLILFL